MYGAFFSVSEEYVTTALLANILGVFCCWGEDASVGGAFFSVLEEYVTTALLAKA